MSEAFVGEIRRFLFQQLPNGWLPCDGQVVPTREYSALYQLIANAYGGDGETTFGLPDLGANAPMHRSNLYPMGKSSTGALAANPSPAPLLYLIAVTTPELPDITPYIGEVRTFGFGAVPKGWALCDGSILNIESNTALFTLLENRYGGSSDAGTFALPDLRTNTLNAQSGSDPLGCVVMSDCIATIGEFPSSS